MASNGCFIGVMLARMHDQLPLCSYTDENYSNSNFIRQQMKRIIERMETPASTADRSASRGSYYQSFDHKDCIYFAFQDSGTNLTVITALNKVLLRNSADELGTNKLACKLLDMVMAEFLQTFTIEEIESKHVKPFHFIKFDTVLRKCIARVIQQDRASGDGLALGCGSGAVSGTGRRQVNPNYESLRQEITDVHFVMRKNLEDLMKRGEKLETMNNYSAQLVDQSSRYYQKTVHLNRMRLVRMYAPVAIVAFVLILFLFIYFF
ncbi:unnamed protein product [Phytomonas sp. Hart1]|nr:unnamed protein product [Phytomonas sp. Hart1]|eukprot:CCW71535.1 unnamed protein product [Phytomonas sp. isolate Hart1]